MGSAAAQLPEALALRLQRAAAAAPSEHELAREESRELTDVRGRLTRAGVWDRLDARGRAAVMQDRPESTRAIELVRAWLSPACSRPALVLLGEPGVGKTVAAAWTVARYADARYATAEELCTLRAAGTKLAAARWRAHVRAPLLVVDELGTERARGLAMATLWSVIDGRQALPFRTLLLGNGDPATLTRRYDGRVIDRLGVESDASGIAIIRTLRGRSLRVPGERT